jgi:hypothetical protein
MRSRLTIQQIDDLYTDRNKAKQPYFESNQKSITLTRTQAVVSQVDILGKSHHPSNQHRKVTKTKDIRSAAPS